MFLSMFLGLIILRLKNVYSKNLRIQDAYLELKKKKL